MHKTVLTWFDNLPMSTNLLGFNYYQEKNTKSDSTAKQQGKKSNVGHTWHNFVE